MYKVLIVFICVVMLGTFTNGLHNGWYDHRPFKYGVLYQNQAKVGPVLEHVSEFEL